MYGSTSYEYTDVLVAREMEKDYFGPYLVTEIFRYGPFLGSNRSQRESKCGLKQGIFIYFLDYFIFVDKVQPLKPIYVPKMDIFGLFWGLKMAKIWSNLFFDPLA